MKTLSYFLLALAAVLAVTASPGDPVLDVNGKPIFRGLYYVLPRISGSAGGLALTTRDRNQCRLFLGQEYSEVDKGIPVRFSNWMSRVGFVPESENLNIEMVVKDTSCPQSTFWWVTHALSPKLTFFITAGRKPESEEEDSLLRFFQIKKTGEKLGGYKIVFCRTDNDCMDVGIVDDFNVQRLGLSSTPYEFVFMKATGSETSSNTMSMI